MQLATPSPHRDDDLHALAEVATDRTRATAESSLTLSDANGPFLVFGNTIDFIGCLRESTPPGEWKGGPVGDVRMFTRQADGTMPRVYWDASTDTLASTIHRVAAGDLATGDGQQTLTKVSATRVNQVDQLATWSDKFPGTYRATRGWKVTVEQVSPKRPGSYRTYDFLVSAAACNG